MDDFSRSIAAASLVDGQHFTLPGHGTLEGIYVSARIDHGAKSVEPPHLEVRWTTPEDPDAQTFAELLARTGATSQEAAEAEERWTSALSAGKAIRLGDLGTLQRDAATDLVAFTPNEEALRRAYWGGPSVSLEPLSNRVASAPPIAPIVEIDTQATTATDAVTLLAAPAPPSRALRSTKRRSLRAPLAVAASLLLLAVIAYFVASRDSQPKASERGQVVAVNQERLNKSPRDLDSKAPTLTDDSDEDTPFGAAEAPEGGVAGDEDAGYSTEAIPSSDDQFDPAALAGVADDESIYEDVQIDAVIVIGSFGQAANAARMTEKLAAAGYVPYVDQPNTLTRVGITFSASSEAEIAEMLQQVRSEYNPSAWVLE